ncbi:hypothetical protein DBV15_07763 [Temnothorax longispinosus]|uniref:Uncharacterized protein n=1 Tax=Temnothorax longispinosus TaxID=300112 RepID=A0A4S2L1T5_9HYME|nr:hypothetical protein DBV15_07763 [Temnothorax longispinosus]
MSSKKGLPNSIQIIGPKRKPRESNPTIKSTSRTKICSTIKSFIALTCICLDRPHPVICGMWHPGIPDNPGQGQGYIQVAVINVIILSGSWEFDVMSFMGNFKLLSRQETLRLYSRVPQTPCERSPEYSEDN